MPDRLEEIKRYYGRLYPDLEEVKRATYLLRRLEAAEAVLEHKATYASWLRAKEVSH